MLKRWLAGLGALAALMGAAPGSAWADYPDHAIKFVLPFAAGQGTDVATRVVMAELQKQLGQALVIENHPGASGMIAIQQVQRAPADGYTILGFSSSFLANTAMFKSLPYDLNRDFTPIIRTVDSAVVLLVSPSLPVRNMAELVAYVRQQPNGLDYASGGNTTTMHLSGELFKSRSGLDLHHVPYKGDPAGLNDVIGGQVKMMFSGVAAALPFVRSGQLRPIAVTTATRVDTLPGVPTIAESGYPGYEMLGWLAYLVPAGTPAPIVEKLNTSMRAVMSQRDVAERINTLGMFVAQPIPPTQLKDYLTRAGAQVTEVLRNAGIKAEQ